jgi:hypothetical protein
MNRLLRCLFVAIALTAPSLSEAIPPTPPTPRPCTEICWHPSGGGTACTFPGQGTITCQYFWDHLWW